MPRQTGGTGAQGTQGVIGLQGSVGPSTTINATDTTTGTYYPVFVAGAGTNQTARVRTTATAFSFNAATNVLTVTATNARYADIAERYISDKKYQPGTVVSFGGDAEITITTKDADSKIAGVITTNPAYLMNSQLQHLNAVDVALQGRVPVKVVGSVEKGDMLVSAGNGRARAEKNPVIGTVIGKSLENFTATVEKQETILEVVIGKN